MALTLAYFICNVANCQRVRVVKALPQIFELHIGNKYCIFLNHINTFMTMCTTGATQRISLLVVMYQHIGKYDMATIYS